jgi:hypothetical protein
MFLAPVLLALVLVPPSSFFTPAPAALSAAACDAAYLGVYVTDSAEGGAEVTRVVPGSPAEDVGLRVGDRLRSLGGQPIDDAGELTAAIAARSAGDEVALWLQRAGAEIELTLRLGSRAEAEERGLLPSLASTALPRAGQDEPTLPSFAGTGTLSEDLAARAAELRQSMDERWQEFAQRLEALRAEQADGSLQERMQRLQDEFARAREEQARRVDELLKSWQERFAGAGQGTLRVIRPEVPRVPLVVPTPPTPPRAVIPVLPRMSVVPSTPGASAQSEIESLRDEVRALREEVQRLKQDLAR